VKHPIITFAVLVLLAGCKTLPDIKPFAQATAELQSVVSKGKNQAMEAISAYKSDPATPEKTRSTLAAQAKELDAAWQATNTGLAALVDYSHALAEVAAAGDSGDKAARNVFNALDGLLKVTPVGAVPGFDKADDAVAAVYRAVAQAKAARDLKEATSRADEAVRVSSEIIAANVATLKRIAFNVGRNYETNVLYLNNQWLIAYHETLLKNEREQAQLLTAIVDYTRVDQDACARVIQEIRWKAEEEKRAVDGEITRACNGNASQTARFASVRGELQRDVMANLVFIQPEFNKYPSYDAASTRVRELNSATLRNAQLNQAELVRIEKQYSEVKARLLEVHKNTDANVAVLNSSEKAARAIAAAHRDLVKALAADHGQFNFREFVSYVQDAANAYKEGNK